MPPVDGLRPSYPETAALTRELRRTYEQNPPRVAVAGEIPYYPWLASAFPWLRTESPMALHFRADD